MRMPCLLHRYHDPGKLGETLADLADHEQVACSRGEARGHSHVIFKSIRTARPASPRPGKPGEQRRLNLELKVLPIGLALTPNAGKSPSVRPPSPPPCPQCRRLSVYHLAIPISEWFVWESI